MGTRAWIIAGSREPPLMVAAEADLSGCPDLLESELAADLLNGTAMELTPVHEHAEPAFSIQIEKRPAVDLVVDRTSLAPLAIRFTSRQLTAKSRILSLRIKRPRTRSER